MPKTIVKYDSSRRYRVTARNAGYDKKTYGLGFREGEATIDPENWKNETQRSPEDVLNGIQRDFPDFEVEAYGGGLTVTTPDLDHLRTPDGRLRTAADEDAPRKGGRRRAGEAQE